MKFYRPLQPAGASSLTCMEYSQCTVVLSFYELLLKQTKFHRKGGIYGQKELKNQKV